MAPKSARSELAFRILNEARSMAHAVAIGQCATDATLAARLRDLAYNATVAADALVGPSSDR